MKRVVIECAGRLANEILCYANARYVLDALGLENRLIVINYPMPDCVSFPGAVARREQANHLPKVTRDEIAAQDGDCLWSWLDVYRDFPPCDVMKEIIQGIELDEVFVEQIASVICHDHFVGIHARFGDFVAIDPANPPKVIPPFVRGSNEYFLNAMAACREAIPGVKFFLASDGTPEELEFITRQSDVVVGRPDYPVFDLFALSECRLLIGSNSTFSSVAAQFGNVPWVNPAMTNGEIATIIQSAAL